MRVLLALAFLLWASAAATLVPEHTGSHKTHYYDLTLNITGTVPGMTSQLSKSVLKAKFLLCEKEHNKYIVKLAEPKISKAISSVGSDEEPIPLVQDAQLQRDLVKTIRFTVRNGRIHDYTLGKSESEASKRVKWSVLRHIDARLRDIGEVEVDPRPKRPFAYNTTRDTIYGPVTSWYVENISPYPDFPYERHVLNISAVERYENLGYPAYHRHHNIEKQGCPEVCQPRHDCAKNYSVGCPMGYESQHTLMKLHVVNHYHRRLMGRQMVLENVTFEDKHVASMYDQDMIINIRANYILTGADNRMLEEPREQQEYHNLEYDILPESSTTHYGGFDYMRTLLPPSELSSSHMIAVVKDTWNKIIKTVMESRVESHESQVVGEHVIILQRTLAMLDMPTLRKVWKEIIPVKNYRSGSEKEKMLRQIIMDVLPLCGTQNCVELIAELIQKEELNIWEATNVLEALSENVIAINTEIIKSIQNLLELPHVKRHHILHSAAHLCTAKLIKNACVVTPFLNGSYHPEEDFGLPEESNPEELEESNKLESEAYGRLLWETEETNLWPRELTTCPRNLARRFIMSVLRKLKSTRMMQEKAVYIQTLAQCGSTRVAKHLLPYVYGLARDTSSWTLADIDFFKTVAIYSLHHVVEYHPQEWLRLVGPVYFNHTEAPRVRIAAFTVLMKGQPSLSLLQHMAVDSWMEPSKEVGSFVYSTMQEYGNSTEPCMQLTAQRIKYVISQFKSFDLGYQYAKNILTTFFDQLRNFGFVHHMSYVPSNETIIPHGLHSSLTFNIDSLKDVLYRMAINIQGLENEKLYKLIDEELLGWRMPKDIPRDIDQRIFKDMTILHRIPKEMRLTVYKRIFYHSRFVFLSKKTLEETVRPIIEHLRTIFVVESNTVKGRFVKVLIPSSYHTIAMAKAAAFPVELYMKHPMLLTVKLDCPSVKRDELRCLIKPSFYYTTYKALHIINPIENRAYGVHYDNKNVMSLPVEIQLKKLTNKISVMIKLPEMPKMAFRHHSDAATYAGKLNLEDLPSCDNMDLIETIPTTFEKEIKLGLPMLPRLYIVRHTEDISEGKEDIPRNWYEVCDLALKYVRNQGWRRSYLNATVIKSERGTVDTIKFDISLKTTFKESHTCQGADSMEWDEEKQNLYAIQEAESSLGMTRNEAKKVHNKLACMPHVQHMLEIDAQTTPTLNKANLKVEYNHTVDRATHSISAFWTSTERHANEPRKMSLVHVADYKNMPNEFKYDLFKYGYQEGKFYSAIYLKKHECFNTDADITLTSTLSHVEGRKLFEKTEFSEPIEKEWFFPETHEDCLEDLKEGKPLTVSCIRAIKEESIFNRLRLRAHWKPEMIHPIVKNVTHKIHEAIKYAWYSCADINRLVQNEESTIEVMADYILKLTDTPVMNVKVHLPRETVHYNKVDAKYVLPYSSLYTMKEVAINAITNNTFPPTCALMENSVQTFDLRVFDLPNDKCTYLVSAHCTVNKKYVVLAKKLPENKKEIIIYIENHKIVLKPERSEPGSYVVEFDGREHVMHKDMSISLDKEAWIHVTLVEQHRQNNPIFYGLEFHADVAGIRAIYNGKHLKLQVHPLYKGKVCGLCSEFDSELTMEYRGADQCIYSNDKDFARSTIVNPRECGVKVEPKYPAICPDGIKNYNPDQVPDYKPSVVPDDTDSTTEDADNASPVSGVVKPKPVTYYMDREENTCFSVHPVYMCPEYANAEETEEEEVQFHCLPKYDAATRRLVKEAKKRILVELAHKSVDLTENVESHVSCK